MLEDSLRKVDSVFIHFYNYLFLQLLYFLNKYFEAPTGTVLEARITNRMILPLIPLCKNAW